MHSPLSGFAFKPARFLSVVFFISLLVSSLDSAFARSGGINGYSGNPATNGGAICNACHSGGQTPSVTLDGPTLVAPGTISTYTLTITGGQETAGGLDVSATSGTLVVADPGTYLRSGEITHNSPRNADGGGAVVFSFNWQAPAAPGTEILYGAGNSVNLGNGSGGDFPNRDELSITVSAPASGPGETSGNGLAPLRVTGRDVATGELSIDYEAGCEATNTNIYFGPLDAVSSYAWDSETCAIGTSGSFSSFNPGSGDYFFVVVGNNGTDEGSYGTDRQLNGTENERQAYLSNACGQQQVLDDRCD